MKTISFRLLNSIIIIIKVQYNNHEEIKFKKVKFQYIST